MNENESMELPQAPKPIMVETKKVKVDDMIIHMPAFIKTELQISYYHSMYVKIKDSGLVTDTRDVYALGMLAVNLALVDEATQDLCEKGFHMEVQGDRNKIMKKNPSLDVLKDAQSNVRAYLKEFKMTPATRSKQLDTGNPDGDDGFGDL